MKGVPDREVLIGVDIGTNSSKGVACRSDGHVIAEARAEHGVSFPRPGWAEHDADGVWWRDFCSISRQLSSRLPRGSHVAGVATSTCGPCLVPVDARGRPLRPAILYRVDSRASEQIKTLIERHGARAMLELGASRLTSQSVGPKIMWIRDNEPDIHARTSQYLTGAGYLVFRLTGEYVVDHHHSSYFGPFVDIRRGQWDLRFSDGCVAESQLPTIRWSSEVVGVVTPEASLETGLPAGTPVAAGSTDGHLEALAAGVLGRGTLMVNYASVMNVMTTVDRVAATEHLWLSEGLQRGEYLLAGGVATGGSITTWFRQQLAQELPQRSSADIALAYAALIAEAESSPIGSNGLLMLPYFSGEDTPFYDPDARGVLVGLSLATTRGDVYRSILEATAMGIRHNLVEIQRAGVPIVRVRAIGGGATSRLWPQIVSDVTGLAQEVPVRTAGAAFGSAYVAGLATGLVAEGDLERSWITVAGVIEPAPRNRDRYETLYAHFRQLYSGTRRVVHELAAEAGEGDGRP